jgi:hypothetical protein
MSLKNSILSGAAAISLIAGVAAFTGSAHADTIEIKLDQTNLGGQPGSYADVTVNRISDTLAIITFTSLTQAGNIYLLGDGGSVAVNVNAASWTLGPTRLLLSAATPEPALRLVLGATAGAAMRTGSEASTRRSIPSMASLIRQTQSHSR